MTHLRLTKSCKIIFALSALQNITKILVTVVNFVCFILGNIAKYCKLVLQKPSIDFSKAGV
jgi:hypothetical protein